jgi:hypothetical protein
VYNFWCLCVHTRRNVRPLFDHFTCSTLILTVLSLPTAHRPFVYARTDAQTNFGAQWCACSHVSDSDVSHFPMQAGDTGDSCGGPLAGVRECEKGASDTPNQKTNKKDVCCKTWDKTLNTECPLGFSSGAGNGGSPVSSYTADGDPNNVCWPTRTGQKQQGLCRDNGQHGGYCYKNTGTADDCKASLADMSPSFVAAEWRSSGTYGDAHQCALLQLSESAPTITGKAVAPTSPGNGAGLSAHVSSDTTATSLQLAASQQSTVHSSTDDEGGTLASSVWAVSTVGSIGVLGLLLFGVLVVIRRAAKRSASTVGDITPAASTADDSALALAVAL